MPVGYSLCANTHHDVTTFESEEMVCAQQYGHQINVHERRSGSFIVESEQVFAQLVISTLIPCITTKFLASYTLNVRWNILVEVEPLFT